MTEGWVGVELMCLQITPVISNRGLELHVNQTNVRDVQSQRAPPTQPNLPNPPQPSWPQGEALCGHGQKREGVDRGSSPNKSTSGRPDFPWAPKTPASNLSDGELLAQLAWRVRGMHIPRGRRLYPEAVRASPVRERRLSVP